MGLLGNQRIKYIEICSDMRQGSYREIVMIYRIGIKSEITGIVLNLSTPLLIHISADINELIAEIDSALPCEAYALIIGRDIDVIEIIALEEPLLLDELPDRGKTRDCVIK